jgi:F420-non-reducing hydrogenase iron-sulfur subunit
MTVKRMIFLQEMLAFLGLEGRLHLEWISSAEAQKFVRVITDFTEKIRALGPNPLPDYAIAARAFDLDLSRLIKRGDANERYN